MLKSGVSIVWSCACVLKSAIVNFDAALWSVYVPLEWSLSFYFANLFSLKSCLSSSCPMREESCLTSSSLPPRLVENSGWLGWMAPAQCIQTSWLLSSLLCRPPAAWLSLTRLSLPWSSWLSYCIPAGLWFEISFAPYITQFTEPARASVRRSRSGFCTWWGTSTAPPPSHGARTSTLTLLEPPSPRRRSPSLLPSLMSPTSIPLFQNMLNLDMHLTIHTYFNQA